MSQQNDAGKWAMVEKRDVSWLLQQWGKRTPDESFLIWEPFSGGPLRWTYRAFNSDVEAVAAALNRRGVVKGEHVLIHMDNCPEFLITWFACARIGAVAVSTNTASVLRDMEYFAEHAEVVCALTQPAYATLVQDSAPNIRFLVVIDNDAGETQGSEIG